MGIEIFKKHIREKRAIKISAKSTNIDTVAKICRAAQNAKVSAVDICANKKVYDVARKNTKLSIFTSSVSPFEILEAVKLGADGVQIGGFLEYYKQGRFFSADEIYNIVLETLGLINDYDVFISATIPSYLETHEQIELIKKMQLLGVELFQIEGVEITTKANGLVVEDANKSILNMIELSKIIGVDFMTIAQDVPTVKSSIDNGANAVSIENISKLDSEHAMRMTLLEIVSSISHKNSLYKEIPRSLREMQFN